MRKELIINVICSLLILLFVYTAGSKLVNLDLFRSVLNRLPVIGLYSSILYWMLPVTELIIAVLLMVKRWRLKGLYGSLFLLLLFTGYLCFALLHEEKLPCTCGGVISKLRWEQHVVFNCFFIMISISGIYLYRSFKNIVATNGK